jgi:Ni/Fe-hydrogenase b-type cytochrome subunit
MKAAVSSTKTRCQHCLLVRESKTAEAQVARWEHPYIVRLTHWVSALSIMVMIFSGIEIFRAFPTFGAKIPEKDLVTVPSWLGLGGWLGGSLQWHLTFMWPLIANGLVYALYQVISGNYRQVLFTRKDILGVWPMVRHYFFFGPKPESKDSYNPLQKLAYTVAILLGVVAVLTGLALYKPVQLSALARLMGGFGKVRMWHFGAMLGLISFITGHLVMVALHGWGNFYSMLIGWKKGPARSPLHPNPDAAGSNS